MLWSGDEDHRLSDERKVSAPMGPRERAIRHSAPRGKPGEVMKLMPVDGANVCGEFLRAATIVRFGGTPRRLLVAAVLALLVAAIAHEPARAQGAALAAVEAVAGGGASDAEEPGDADTPAGEAEAEELLAAPEEARVPAVASPASLAREAGVEELLIRLRADFATMPPAEITLLTVRLRRSCQLVLSETNIMLAQASMLHRELDLEARALTRKHSRVVAQVGAGRYSPAEARDAVGELAQEATRYDGLFQEAVAAGEQLQPRIRAAEALASAALEYVAEFEAAEDRPLGQTVEGRELLDRTRGAARDLADRAVAATQLNAALGDIANACAENAALAADGVVAIHQGLAARTERGLLEPVAARPSRATLTRAAADLQAIPRALGSVFRPEQPVAWLDVVPTQLTSAEQVGARALVAIILIVVVAVGWRAGPAKLRALAAGNEEQVADVAVLLALLRAAALYFVGLAVIALLRLEPAWFGLLATALAWVVIWLVWSGAVGAAVRLRAAGEDEEARALSHAYHWGGVLLLWSAVCVTLLRGLSLFQYSAADVIYALQLVYGLVACPLVLILVACHGGPLTALPAGRRLVGYLRRAAGEVNPTVAVVAVALLGALLVGYANLAAFFSSRLGLTTLVLGVGILVHTRARAYLSQHMTAAAGDEAADEDDEADRVSVRRAALVGQVVLVAVIAAVLLARIWGVRTWHVSQAMALLSQPVISVKGTEMSVLSVLKGVLIIAAGMAVGRSLRRRIARSKALALRYDTGVRHAFATVAHYGVLLAGVAVGLHVAGLQLTALAVFAGMVGIAVGFGSQHIASNFIAGIILTFDRSIDVGDFVEVGGQQGTVTQITLRSTTIRSPDNKMVVIPNSSLIGQNVVGTTQRDRRVRLLVDVAVAGDSDADTVASVLTKTALGTEGILTEPPPEAWTTKLAAASMTFQLAAWTDQPQHQDRIRGLLTTAVGKALKDSEISVA